MNGSKSAENAFPERVIECLRNGVPGESAVAALGSNQDRIISRFIDSLNRSTRGADDTGFVIEAAFGCGKSHVLAHLRQIALQNNFACSIVCVSKEMTLATIGHIFANAIRELRIPGKAVGGTTAEFLDHVEFDSSRFAGLLQHYSDDEDPVGSIFGASLHLFERYQRQPDVVDYLIDFWDGARCPISDIKRDLKALGLPHRHLRAPAETTLGLHRVQFVTNLLKAAGYSGWVFLIDEGEMIAKLGLIGRAKAYANLASLLGAAFVASVSRVVGVLTVTNDLWHVLLTERDDRRVLYDRVRIDRPRLAEVALESLDYLYDLSRREEIRAILLEELETLRDRVAEIYRQAYPAANGEMEITRLQGTDSRNVRSFLKEWITDWDLRRIYPGYVPHLEQSDTTLDLSENPDYVESAETEA